jgi:hypothetical protein
MKDKFENRMEYVGIIKTPYHNLMLDRQILRIEKKPTGHRLFLPQ